MTYSTWGARNTRPFIPALGTLATAASGGAAPGGGLSVKAYTVSGVKVWGSYNSPSADSTLKAMKAQINRFGAGLDPNGLVGPKTVDAIKKIAGRYTGWREGASTILELLALTVGGPEMVARQGARVLADLRTLADAMNVPAVGAPATPAPVVKQTSGSSSTVVASAPIFPPDYGQGGEAVGVFGLSPGTTKVAFAGATVVAAFFIARELKNKKRGKSRRGR